MSSRFSHIITLLILGLLSFATIRGKAQAQPQSDLYVANFFGNKITRHDASSGALISSFTVFQPTGAQLGPDGNLYVVSYDHTLRRYNAKTGAVMATLATNIATFPDDLIFGPDGNIYIPCEFGPGILRYSIGGAPMPSVNNTGATFFFGPSNRFVTCTFGADGNLYATDFGANQVFRFSPSGSLLGAFVATNLHGPIDVKFGPDGNLFVANRETDNISKFNGSTGAFLGIFASGNGLSKTDSFDFGLDGNLYVASRTANKVTRFDGMTGVFIDEFITSGLNDPYNIRFYGVFVPFKISGLSPNSVKIGSGTFRLTISGAGFSPNPIVRFNNTQMTVVASNSASIAIDVSANLLTTVRNYNVTVSVNGKLSNASPFRVVSDVGGPPNLKIGPVFRTGTDQFSGVKFAVLLLENQGTTDITTINLSTARLYYDTLNPGSYITPSNITLENGALPPGNLSRTRPGERLQVRFDFPSTANGPVRTGIFSVIGTSDQGAINAGSLSLRFP